MSLAAVRREETSARLGGDPAGGAPSELVSGYGMLTFPPLSCCGADSGSPGSEKFVTLMPKKSGLTPPFFAGISAKLNQRPSRVAILVLGYAMFLGTVVWISTFPVSVAV